MNIKRFVFAASAVFGAAGFAAFAASNTSGPDHADDLAAAQELLIRPAIAIEMSLDAQALLANTTQQDFDKAVQCCWAWSDSVNSYCSTPNACREGKEYCTSRYFEKFDNSKSEGRLRCDAMDQ